MRTEKGLNGFANAVNGGPNPRPGWQARLQLDFSVRQNRTVLSHRSHRGPLVVQRPFYPEDSVCHVYLLHPPGGVVAGDCLDLCAAVADGGKVLLTTPAAGKFYRSSGAAAHQSVAIRIDHGASMEWLPQETIVYDGAILTSGMRIDLDDNARFIGWEIYAFGRPAAGEDFRSGNALLNWSIYRSGKPFHIERMQVDAEAFSARWGLNGQSSCGSLFAYPASGSALETVRALTAGHDTLGVTCIDNLLICRGIDTRADRLRHVFQQLWAAIRQEIVGHAAVVPRIWST
ncbi:MAG: urease accessory protein UreD [Gammaproteobacteria bacterium]